MRLLWVLLVGLLSACTITLEGVTLSYRLDLTPAILRFEPDRGAGASYFVGEEIRFLLTLGRPGWVSLVVIDPDGRAYELDRLYLGRGTHLLPRGAYRYRLIPPRGLHRVRAVYTEAPPADRVRLEGVFSDWDARLRVYLEASGARGYQVAETHFYLY